MQLLGELLWRYGIQDFVISPGSRNAPLTLQFSQNPNYHCYSIVDERSAAFFALGRAQAKQKPVAICCTSGTAAANYYPAIIEAFYQNIPLLVITADRPENFVDLFDGQTIRQKNIYEQHCYGSFQLSEEETDEALYENFQQVKNAVHTCFLKRGPVHINIPFSEPLYEQTDTLEINIEKLALPEREINLDTFDFLLQKWNQFSRKLILVGMQTPDENLTILLDSLAERQDVVVFTETTSNIQSEKIFPNIDRLVFNFSEEDFDNFKPDLLLTIGQNVVSKKMKVFLRKSKPAEHWHLDTHWFPDTYFCLTEKIDLPSSVFLQKLVNQAKETKSNYSLVWNELKEKQAKKHQAYMEKVSFSDLSIFEVLSKNIPDYWNIHFSNSSSIRYSQLFDFNSNHQIYCNRGTSGIEGSISTSVGFASASDKPTLLVCGDIGFFYDSNAFWNRYVPANFRVILINNGGGNIFKFISNTKEEKILDDFFVTKHQRTAKLVSEEYGFEYLKIDNKNELKKELPSFFTPSDKPKLLEVNTQNIDNAQILKDYFIEITPD